MTKNAGRQIVIIIIIVIIFVYITSTLVSSRPTGNVQERVEVGLLKTVLEYNTAPSTTSIFDIMSK